MFESLSIYWIEFGVVFVGLWLLRLYGFGRYKFVECCGVCFIVNCRDWDVSVYRFRIEKMIFLEKDGFDVLIIWRLIEWGKKIYGVMWEEREIGIFVIDLLW